MQRVRLLLFVIAIGLLAPGCRSPKPRITEKRPDYETPLPPGKMALEKITNPAEYPYFGEGFREQEGLLKAIDLSLGYFGKPSSQKYYPYLDVSHARAKQSLLTFKTVLANSKSETEFHETIIEAFDVYRSVGYNGKGVVLFTAYCEPIYEGSLTRTDQFRYPLYKLPADLVKGEEGVCLGRKTETGAMVPYYTRAEIEKGNLFAGQELVYLKNKLEAYIVHVQGSARLKLPDGKEFRVGYAGKTDRPYTSIGRALIDDQKIRSQDLSLRKIKEYFGQHPEELDQYLNRNESYVFFTQTEGGPYGSIGVPVTPYRSIATDKAVFPRGCLAFVKTTMPFLRGQAISVQNFHSFALDQDTGGAIRSAGRTDIFAGTGPEAELLAGRTNAEGKLYYIFVKEPAPVVSSDGQSPAGSKKPVARSAANPRSPTLYQGSGRRYRDD
jgi:membrane-bound lytic murein transglycosylase A